MVGGNSKTASPFRTIQGFSTGAKGKMYEGCPGCPYKHYKQFYDYYGSHTYADDWALAALGGTTLTYAGAAGTTYNFALASDASRKEAVKKGTAYMHVWMYAIREFEDAIDDCVSCTTSCNTYSANDGGPVHAWDEGVAFYTGSREGTLPGGSTSGKMVYRLAEKRCGNFGTCLPRTKDAAGESQVNHALFKLFAQGRDLLHAGTCSGVRPVVDQIVSLMTVPLVQGTLRYAWKVGKTGGADNKLADQSAKNAAEGSTFAAAVLPLVHACDAAAAKVVSDNMKFGAAVYDKTSGAFTSGTKPDTGAVKAALEKTYSCLGITCAHVGGLLGGDGVTAEAGMETCTDSTPAPPAAKIAGYMVVGGSVSEHAELDLDQKAMETALGLQDYATAKTWYTAGGNSKTAAPFRTLQGFSTGAQAKMYDGAAFKDGVSGALKCPGCPYKHYKQFYDYYGSHTYADDWALAALDGTTLTYAAPASVTYNFADAAGAARKEAIKKGTAYMHVWMYVIREFEDAIDDCTTCTANCNEYSANDGGSVHAWDEGVAFYTGSLEGPSQGGNSAGKMVYRLAEKRCGNFGTCTGAGGMSQVNDALFKAGGLFPQGRDLLHKGSCSSVRAVVNQIVSIMK